MRYGDPGHVFDSSDVDAETARLAHAEHVARSLIEQRNRAYRRGRVDAMTSDFDNEPTEEYP